MIDLLSIQFCSQQLSITNLSSSIRQLQQENIFINEQIQFYQQKIDKLPNQLIQKIKARSSNQEFIDLDSYKNKDGLNQDDQMNRQVDLQKQLNELFEQQKELMIIKQIYDKFSQCQNTAIKQSSPLKEQNAEIEKIKKIKEMANFMTQQWQTTPTSQQILNLLKSQSITFLTHQCTNLIHIQKLNHQQTINMDVKIILRQYGDEEAKVQNVLYQYFNYILGGIVMYDVNCQMIKCLQVIAQSDYSISRRQVYFTLQDSSKYKQVLQKCLKSHLSLINNLKCMLLPKQDKILSNQEGSRLNKQKKQFQKQLQSQILCLRSNLQYLLPYLSLQSRKQLLTLLSNQSQTPLFQQLILRLKYKGQDGQMFMDNLDSIFNSLVGIQKQQNFKTQSYQLTTNHFLFNNHYFSMLIDFFQFIVFQAATTFADTSTKVVNKLRTNFKIGKNQQKNTNNAIDNKKLLNIIFFSIQTLIQKFDQFININNLSEQSLSIVEEWVDNLLQIRQNIRTKIHHE